MSVTDNDRAAELLQRRRARPFVPFAVVLTDGEEHLIREPLSFTVVNNRLMLPGRLHKPVPVGDIADVVDRKPLSDGEIDLREDLIGRLVHKPFEPFTIHLRDGRHFDVVRKFQAAVGATRASLVNADETAHVEFPLRDVLSLDRRTSA